MPLSKRLRLPSNCRYVTAARAGTVIAVVGAELQAETPTTLNARAPQSNLSNPRCPVPVPGMDDGRGS